jgi:stage III sporulation protein AD
MNILSIVGIAIIGVAITLILNNYNKEYAMVVSLCCGLFIFGAIITGLIPIISTINNLAKTYGVNDTYINVILKSLGIAYITQLCINICNDSGQTAIASKVELAGKVVILLLALPLLNELLNISTNLILG